MPAYATFDDSRFPVVFVRFTGATATDENFQAYLDQLHGAYQRRQPFTYLFDATDASLPGFKYQKMQADWLKKNEQLMKEYCQGTAYVIPSAMVRTILRGIFSLQKQPVPYAILPGKEEATEWCEERMQPA